MRKIIDMQMKIGEKAIADINSIFVPETKFQNCFWGFRPYIVTENCASRYLTF
jgi:hypothetical protein